MPIYEFRCRGCGHEFERLQKVSDPDPTRCPECRAAKLVRVISPVGFRLKGSGWYETDFKKTGRRNVIDSDKASGEKKDKAATASGDETKPKEQPAKAEPKKAEPAKKEGGQAVA